MNQSGLEANVCSGIKARESACDSSNTKYRVRKRLMFWSKKLIATSSHFRLTVLHQEQYTCNHTCQLEYKQKFILTNQNLKQMCAAG